MSSAPAIGFVKIYRALLDWEWYQDDRCVRLFLHLLLKANRIDRKWKGQEINRGEWVTSTIQIAEQLGWSRSAVNRTLDKLKSSGDVVTDADNRWTLVTIVNWEKYQDATTTTGQQTDNRRTASGQQTVQPADTTKEVKNKRSREVEKSPKGDPADRRDPQVSDVVEFFEQQLGAALDGSARENRWRAKSLLNRMLKEYPGFDPVVSVKALIKAAREDEFHSKNATSFDYLLRKCRAIIEAKEQREKNPKTQTDEQYRNASLEEAKRRFAGR